MSSALSVSVLLTKIGAPRRRTPVRNRPAHVAITMTMAAAAALLGLHLGLTAPLVSPVMTSTGAELSVGDPTHTAADAR